MRGTRRSLTAWVVLSAMLCGAAASAQADLFTFVDSNGKRQTVAARLAGSGSKLHALELPDGRLMLIPQAALIERTPASGPEPLDGREMEARLRSEFLEQIHIRRAGPFVIGLVTAAPVDAHQNRLDAFLVKAGRFFNDVRTVFANFARDLRIELEKSKFPLIVLIFEDDDDFDTYARQHSAASNTSQQRLSGFYSTLSNRLVLRLSECHTFATPLHEAIHQQVYNRGVFQRLAPIPAWFDEGLATGFESSGERIDAPTHISRRYARLAFEPHQLQWSDVIKEDRPLRGDVFVGEAYTHAWCLHWLLVAHHKVEYMQFLKLLGGKQPLAESSGDERLAEFQQVFGTTPDRLQEHFLNKLKISLRKQGIDLDEPQAKNVRAGIDGMLEYRIAAVRRDDLGGVFAANGWIRNLAPFREMSFYVTLESETGAYAAWHIDRLGIREKTALETRTADQVMQNAPGGPAELFHIRVRSAHADSPAAQAWRQKKFPVPIFQDSGAGE